MQGLTKTCQSRVELGKIVESLPASYRVLRNECDISVQAPIEKCVDDIRVVVKNIGRILCPWKVVWSHSKGRP